MDLDWLLSCNDGPAKDIVAVLIRVNAWEEIFTLDLTLDDAGRLTEDERSRANQAASLLNAWVAPNGTILPVCLSGSSSTPLNLNLADRAGMSVDGEDLTTVRQTVSPTDLIAQPDIIAPAKPPVRNIQYPFSDSNRQPSCVRYLPLCVWSKSYTRLFHAHIQIIDDSNEDDEKIFRQIREIYNINRGYIRRLFSWWRLKKIERVKVSSYMKLLT